MIDKRERATTLAYAMELPAFWMENRRLEPISRGNISSELLSAFHFYLTLDRDKLPLLKPPYHSQLIKHIDKNNVITLAVVEINQDGVSGFIFGPILEKGTDTSLLEASLLSLPNSRFTLESAKDAVETIPKKDKLFIEAWGKVALSYLTKGKEEYRRISTIKSSGNYFYDEGTLSSFSDTLDESDILANTTLEKEISKLIRLGDKKKLKTILIPKGQVGESKLDLLRLFSPDSSIYHIRRIKNALIGINSIFRLSSESAGLPSIYTHSISEEILNEIEKCRDKDDILWTLENMIEKYTDAINHISATYKSPIVLRIQKYVLQHISEEITLSDLSKLTNKNPSYLSRRFKKETHMTLKNYVNMLRINEAKALLEESEISILDIALKVGIPDQSHFAQVFKKNVGMTPRMYRKLNMKA